MRQAVLFTMKRQHTQLTLPEVAEITEQQPQIETKPVPACVAGGVERAIYEFIRELGRVGATCDEIEQSVVFEKHNPSHQTASARLTALKAKRVVVQRYDETPTDGMYKSTRLTRGKRQAAVLIVRDVATQYERAVADRHVIESTKVTQ